MEQFVLLVVQIAQRDVLRYAVKEPGVPSVMITGTTLMLVLPVVSSDMVQVRTGLGFFLHCDSYSHRNCPEEGLLWTREWNNPHG